MIANYKYGIQAHPTVVNSFINMRVLSLIVLVLVVSGCGLTSKKYEEQTGRVMHEIHDKPLPHTLIVALWKGKEVTGNSESSVCYHVENTIADDKGYFTIPEWREPGRYDDLKDKTIHVVAYRKRYRTSELTSEILTDKNFIYYLAKPRNTDNVDEARENRLRYLQELVGRTSCDLKGESRVNLQPMYEAVVEEAEQLAKTEKDQSIVQRLKAWLSYVTKPDEDG